ncbi:MAG: HipA N-terminal domain-containing protein [Opitutales bacterium]
MSAPPCHRSARVLKSDVLAGHLERLEDGSYCFAYAEAYAGPPVSLSLPVRADPYAWTHFPPFFDGLLPEGAQLDALLRTLKLDRYDYFDQLVAVGTDLVGDVRVEAAS